MSVVHSPHLKEEIDLTCLTDGSVPPSVHHYLKLKTKRISMEKVQTIANLANEVEYDYGLSSIHQAHLNTLHRAMKQTLS